MKLKTQKEETSETNLQDKTSNLQGFYFVFAFSLKKLPIKLEIL